MRAIRFDNFGEPATVLKLDDVPMPVPGPDEVRLRLTHRSLNPSDLATLRGMYGRLPKLPGTPGMEGMGIVDAVGTGVKGITLGTRMIPLSIAGSWQEYANVRPEFLIPAPESISDQSAAQFVGNPISAWVMLTQDLNLQPDDWVLQTGAGSTLGRLVIQIAILKGYNTINFVRRPEQVDELLELGADAAYCTDESDLVERVRAKTGGAGASGALDAVGGETGALALRCIRPGGTMLAYGMLSNQPTPVSNGEILFRGTTVRGFWLVQWFRTTPPEDLAPVLNELMELFAKGDLVPPVDREFDLADFQAAVQYAEQPGRKGKVLFTG